MHSAPDQTSDHPDGSVVLQAVPTVVVIHHAVHQLQSGSAVT